MTISSIFYLCSLGKNGGGDFKLPSYMDAPERIIVPRPKLKTAFERLMNTRARLQMKDLKHWRVIADATYCSHYSHKGPQTTNEALTYASHHGFIQKALELLRKTLQNNAKTGLAKKFRMVLFDFLHNMSHYTCDCETIVKNRGIQIFCSVLNKGYSDDVEMYAYVERIRRVLIGMTRCYGSKVVEKMFSQQPVYDLISLMLLKSDQNAKVPYWLFIFESLLTSRLNQSFFTDYGHKKCLFRRHQRTIALNRNLCGALGKVFAKTPKENGAQVLLCEIAGSFVSTPHDIRGRFFEEFLIPEVLEKFHSTLSQETNGKCVDGFTVITLSTITCASVCPSILPRIISSNVLEPICAIYYLPEPPNTEREVKHSCITLLSNMSGAIKSMDQIKIVVKVLKQMMRDENNAASEEMRAIYQTVVGLSIKQKYLRLLIKSGFLDDFKATCNWLYRSVSSNDVMDTYTASVARFLFELLLKMCDLPGKYYSIVSQSEIFESVFRFFDLPPLHLMHNAETYAGLMEVNMKKSERDKKRDIARHCAHCGFRETFDDVGNSTFATHQLLACSGCSEVVKIFIFHFARSFQGKILSITPGRGS